MHPERPLYVSVRDVFSDGRMLLFDLVDDALGEVFAWLHDDALVQCRGASRALRHRADEQLHLRHDGKLRTYFLNIRLTMMIHTIPMTLLLRYMYSERYRETFQRYVCARCSGCVSRVGDCGCHARTEGEHEASK